MDDKSNQIIEVSIVFICIAIMTMFYFPLVYAVNNKALKMMIMLLFYVICALVPVIICKVTKRPLKSLGFKKENLLDQIEIAVRLVAVLLGVFIFIPLLFGAEIENLLPPKINSIEMLIFYLIYFFVFVGFGEEILFRGYFLERFMTISNSKALSIILSSILFGLWHYPGGNSILKVIFATLFGIIVSTARLKFKNCSVVSVAVAHGAYDVIVACVLRTFLL